MTDWGGAEVERRAHRAARLVVVVCTLLTAVLVVAVVLGLWLGFLG